MRTIFDKKKKKKKKKKKTGKCAEWCKNALKQAKNKFKCRNWTATWIPVSTGHVSEKNKQKQKQNKNKQKTF